jgi:leucyl/phenylalanyl-tRNA---protein transferase
MSRDFTPERVLYAYLQGVFPMYDSHDDRIIWLRPDPRAIFPLKRFHISKSLAKTIRKGIFEVRFNTDFEGVMRGCADREEGTWITEDFIEVYGELHRAGLAHSVETWKDGQLVGGTYGVAIGAAFMAESMFHRETDASKVALAALVARLNERGFSLLDTQYLTSHLASLGAVEISHAEYYERLQVAVTQKRSFD